MISNAEETVLKNREQFKSYFDVARLFSQDEEFYEAFTGQTVAKIKPKLWMDIFRAFHVHKYGTMPTFTHVTSKRDGVYGGFTGVFDDKFIDDLTQVSISSYYPSIMCNKLTGKTSYSNVFPILSDVIAEYGMWKSLLYKYYSDKELRIVRSYINVLYGILLPCRFNLVYEGNITAEVYAVQEKIMGGILEEFGSKVVAIDTDTIWFRDFAKISSEFDAYFREKLPWLSYDFDKNGSGIFFHFHPKKYIFVEGGILDKNGITRTINSSKSIKFKGFR